MDFLFRNMFGALSASSYLSERSCSRVAQPQWMVLHNCSRIWPRGTSRYTVWSPITQMLTTPSPIIGWFTSRLWLKAVVVVKKQRSSQRNPVTSYRQTAITRMPRPPSAVSRTWSTRTSAAQICTWLQGIEPASSHPASSLWCWRGCILPHQELMSTCSPPPKQ